MKNHRIPSEELILAGVDAIYQAQSAASLLLKKERQRMLSEVTTTKIDNITRDIDEMAEVRAREALYSHFEKTRYSDSLEAWGEETITDKRSGIELNFHGVSKTVALLDMIDGTDLVYRELSNWCSAIVFFYPPEREILAALVGLPGTVYCADAREAFSMKPCPKAHFNACLSNRVKLTVPPQKVPIDQSGICFYGQKSRNLLSLFGGRFSSESVANELSLEPMLTSFAREKPPFRIYNLGGNPMMAKVADGTMQAVFELLGQKPHDVVPGAYIARMAGAVVKDLEGNDLNLEQSLLRPNVGDLRYIIASHEGLYSELLAHLRSGISGVRVGDEFRLSGGTGQ